MCFGHCHEKNKPDNPLSGERQEAGGGELQGLLAETELPQVPNKTEPGINAYFYMPCKFEVVL